MSNRACGRKTKIYNILPLSFHLMFCNKVLPVNRLFTVDAGVPTPDLKCVVGFHSIEEEVSPRCRCPPPPPPSPPQHWGRGECTMMIQLVESFLKVTWRMNCSEAHTKEMVLSKVNFEISKLISFEACSMQWDVYDQGPSQSSEVGAWTKNPKVRKNFLLKPSSPWCRTRSSLRNLCRRIWMNNEGCWYFILRFGSQSNGEPWLENVSAWKTSFSSEYSSWTLPRWQVGCAPRSRWRERSPTIASLR